MPIGPLIVFGIIAVVVALIFAMMLMPPNKLVDKLGKKKKN